MKMKNKLLLFLCAIMLFSIAGCAKADPSENISSSVANIIEDKAVEEIKDVEITGNEVIDTASRLMTDDNELFLRAVEIADGMTLEEKAGQLFFARFPDEGAEEEIACYHPAGYIFFGRDFENSSPEKFKTDIEKYQGESKITLLTGVDEEGGTVVRASKYPQFRKAPFKSPRELYNEGGIDKVLEDAEEKSDFLKKLGINVNLAPVCDISNNSDNFIYDRSIGLDPQKTAEYVVRVQNEMKKHGMGSIIKHFPGYGDNADTHTGESIDTRDLDYLSRNDLVPFAAAIENGCDAILVSHNIIDAIDKDNIATLSPAVHEFLRNEMDFKGVIVTDDMAMGAVENIDSGDAAVKAVLAGNDLIITSDLKTQYEAVLQALKSGEIGDNRLDESVCRVLLWKLKMGIIE